MGSGQTAYLPDDSWIHPCLNSKLFRVNMGSSQSAHLSENSWIRPSLNRKKIQS
jgi:hypothetical protein